MALRLADTEIGQREAGRPLLTVVARRPPPRVYSPLRRRRPWRPMAVPVVPREPPSS